MKKQSGCKMNTILLIGSTLWLMVHSSDLAFNESFEATSPPCSTDYKWSTRLGKCVEKETLNDFCRKIAAFECQNLVTDLHPQCLPGFYGNGCSETCRYPNYGDGCQQKCQCAERMCHAAKGCKEPGTSMDKEEILPMNTSNVLLGCMVFLLAILVLLKTSKYLPMYKNRFHQNGKGSRDISRYYSLRFENNVATTTQPDGQGTTCDGASVVGTI